MVLTGVIAAWAVALVVVSRVSESVLRDAVARSGVIVDALEQVMLHTLDGADAQLGLVALRRNRERVGDAEGARALGDLLRSAGTLKRFGLSQSTLVDAEGWMVWTTFPSANHSDYWLGDRDYFLSQRTTPRDLSIGVPVIGRITGEWTSQLSRGLVDARGKFDGLAITLLDLSALSETLAHFNRGTRDVSSVERIDGHVLARSRDAQLYVGAIASADDPVIRQASLKQGGVIDETSNLDGRRTVTAFRRVRGSNLVVTTSFDVDEELAQADWVRWAALAAAAIVTALLGLFLVAGRARAGQSVAVAEALASREAHRDATSAYAEVNRLLAGMPSAVYRGVLSGDGAFEITAVSDNVEDVTGLAARDVIGVERWYGAVRERAGSEVGAFFDRVLSAGESQIDYAVPYSLETTNGARALVWIRDRARVADRVPGGVEIVGNWSDISRERAMSEQAVETAKLATLGELATGLAHELNQPIAVMSLAAENADEALADGEDGIEDARQRLRRIVEQARRAKNIVAHLKVFGRADTGQLEPIVLQNAVEGALVLVGNMLRAAGVRIVSRVPPDLPPVLGRLVLIEQVLVNLCANARDAMRETPFDERMLIIDARSVESGVGDAGEVELRVTDTGPGVPPEVMQRLFEPFFTTKSSGTGLGLSISHGMMQSMSGSLSAINVDRGACFVMTLRAARAAARADSLGAEVPGRPMD